MKIPDELMEFVGDFVLQRRKKGNIIIW